MLATLLVLVPLLGSTPSEDSETTPTEKTNPSDAPQAPESSEPETKPQKTLSPASASPEPPSPAAEEPGQGSMTAAEENRAVMVSYSKHRHDHKNFQRRAGRRIWTVHLRPDGTPLSEVPSSVSERDTIQFKVWNVRGVSNHLSIDVTGCEDLNLERINGASNMPAEQLEDSRDYSTTNLGLALRCGAGTATVKIKSTQPGGGDTVKQTFEIDFTPTYSMSVGVGMVYNTSPTGTLSLTPLGDDSNGHVLTRSEAHRGIQTTALLLLHPFGYRPSRVSWGGNLVNPTLGLSLSAKVYDQAYLGNSFGIPGLPGLWLTGGYHIQQVTRPTSASGVSIGGQTDTGNLASIATESIWTEPFRTGGLYIGLAFDVATFMRIKDQDTGQNASSASSPTTTAPAAALE